MRGADGRGRRAAGDRGSARRSRRSPCWSTPRSAAGLVRHRRARLRRRRSESSVRCARSGCSTSCATSRSSSVRSGPAVLSTVRSRCARRRQSSCATCSSPSTRRARRPSDANRMKDEFLDDRVARAAHAAQRDFGWARMLVTGRSTRPPAAPRARNHRAQRAGAGAADRRPARRLAHRSPASCVSTSKPLR